MTRPTQGRRKRASTAPKEIDQAALSQAELGAASGLPTSLSAEEALGAGVVYGPTEETASGDQAAATGERAIGERGGARSWRIPAPRSKRRVRPWVWWTAGTLSLLGALVLSAWFLLPIKTVEITGNTHLSAQQIKQLAGLGPSKLGGSVGWLFYGKRQVNGLLSDPWIRAAKVLRRFPDTVQIAVTERHPVLRAQGEDSKVQAVAEDGHILPDAGDLSALPSVSGWGPERLADAALITGALSRYTVQSVAYTPSCLSVTLAGGKVWSGDLKSIVKYAGSISMYPNKTINIYPWGVSVQQ